MKPIKALTISLIAFSVMYFGWKLVLRKYPLISGEYIYVWWFNIGMIVCWVLPTYLTAIMIRAHGFVYAAITGLLEVCIAALYSALSGHAAAFFHHWYEWLWSGIAAGGAGGLIWIIQSLIMRFTRGVSNTKSGLI